MEPPMRSPRKLAEAAPWPALPSEQLETSVAENSFVKHPGCRLTGSYLHGIGARHRPESESFGPIFRIFARRGHAVRGGRDCTGRWPGTSERGPKGAIEKERADVCRSEDRWEAVPGRRG